MASNGSSNGVSTPKDFKTKLFLNNEWVESHSKERLSVYSPFDESLVTDQVQSAGEEDVDIAVGHATKAFKKGPWSTMSATDRARVMNKFADLVESKVMELAPLESIAMGAPVQLQAWTVKLVVDTFRYYAGWADKIAGEVFPDAGGSPYQIVRYEPLGVCAGIGAWNGSFMLFAMKAAPALAAGNTFIYKASEKSPLGTLALADIFIEAGFPPGVVQFLNGDGTVGAMLSAHMKIAKISYTGSIGSGRKVQEAAAKSNLKRVTLELGGKSPAIVFNDANFDNAITQLSDVMLMNSGQVCIAQTRTLVQEDIAPKFIEVIKKRFEGAAQGMGPQHNPLDLSTALGPLADKKQFERVMSYIDVGKKEAELVVGGNRIGDKGTFVAPTIFLNPKDDARIYKEEIFGPVSTIRTFKTEEEAIELANDTTYGLSASVYTTSVSRALRVSGKIESGTVGVNMAFIPTIQVPFGGYKESGLGREGGRQALLHYMETKSVSINMNV